MCVSSVTEGVAISAPGVASAILALSHCAVNTPRIESIPGWYGVS
jgi:hypothetical protein